MDRLLMINTNRHQLKHLDYKIALAVAEAATGCKGVRAFRQLSYKRLHTDFSLQSLQELRNKR